MTGDRLFLDTAFVIALLNPSDGYHADANQLLPRVSAASEVWTTEAVLIEIANALSRTNRIEVVRFIERTYSTRNMKMATVDTPLLRRALQLYRDRSDKSWGLTDCISFTVMNDNKVTDALTPDRDFVQAGFVAVLRPSGP